jgi:hypothetical protein
MILKEGLQHMDMENQIFPIITIDEYSAQSNDDDQMITIKFTARYKEVADDLIEWVTKGYEWAMGADCSISEDNTYFVFFEVQRRSTAPSRIIEILIDLKPLTGYKLKDWAVQIDGEEYEASIGTITSNITLSPKAYRELHKDELDDMTDLADLPHEQTDNDSEDIQDMKNIAGI